MVNCAEEREPVTAYFAVGEWLAPNVEVFIPVPGEDTFFACKNVKIPSEVPIGLTNVDVYLIPGVASFVDKIREAIRKARQGDKSGLNQTKSEIEKEAKDKATKPVRVVPPTPIF